MHLSKERLAVGARLLIGDRHKATVWYVGPVAGQDGEWVGVEWDDPDRGKHSGDHEGRRYFDCAPGAGSFVRLPKLLATADAGRSVAEAVAARYLDASAAGTAEEMYVPTVSERRVHVELVGGDEAAAALAVGGQLQQASLVDMRVSRLGLDAAAAAFLRRLSSMDLSDNLISDWRFAVELAAALPTLQTLNLSANRLHFPGTSAADLAATPAASNLRTLVLNGCGVTWQQALFMCRSLPSLTELRLCGNRLHSLQLDAGSPALEATLARLQTLDLEDNALESWSEVATLHMLPSLQALLLSGNHLGSINFPGGFSALESLLLGGNRLGSWAAADALDRFPALVEARLSDNPLPALDPGAARYEAIARVGRLTTLNGSSVGAAERWDAELNYLRQVTNQLAAAPPGGAQDGIRQANPRVDSLVAKYGALAPAAAPVSGGGGGALAKSMVEVVLAFEGREVRKRVPASLTLARLKLLAEKLLGVKAAQQALLLAVGGGEAEDVTQEDGRELRYYCGADGGGGGCRVEVSRGDPEARAAAAARACAAAAQLQELRMERHEQGLQQLRAEEERLMAS